MAGLCSNCVFQVKAFMYELTLVLPPLNHFHVASCPLHWLVYMVLYMTVIAVISSTLKEHPEYYIRNSVIMYAHKGNVHKRIRGCNYFTVQLYTVAVKKSSLFVSVQHRHCICIMFQIVCMYCVCTMYLYCTLV